LLPIGYAQIGSTTDPQLNIALMDNSNQNLTGDQKLLLHWHNRFGHLNLPAASRIGDAAVALSGNQRTFSTTILGYKELDRHQHTHL
jgi:hypothetical protein